MKVRAGHTYRILDGRAWTIAFDPEARGGTYSPEIHVYYRRGAGYVGGRSWRVRVPHVTWAFAYRWRRFGLLTIFRWNHLLIHRLFDAPKAGSR